VISTRVKQDFEFFRDTKLEMIGRSLFWNKVGELKGVSALEAWYGLDTHGKALPCREPEILDKVERGKKSWNLQVKLWAEAMADPPCLLQPELVDYCHGLPPWIFEATIRQAGKLLLESVGYIPRFARLERVHGQWWPPHMDSFDPSI